MAPAARNGPNGRAWFLRPQLGDDEHDPDHRAVEEAEEQAEEHLAPSEPPERRDRA